MRISFVNKKKIYIIIINRELHKYIYIHIRPLFVASHWSIMHVSSTTWPINKFSLIGGQRLEQFRGTRGTQLTAPGSVAPGDSPGMKDVFYRNRGDQVTRWDI